MKAKNLFLFLTILIMGCGNESKQTNVSTKENFNEFFQKFYNDSAFQRSRIQFPLAGINTDSMEMDDTIYYWQESKWTMLHDESDAPGIQKEICQNDSLSIVRFYINDSGFLIEAKFSLIKGRWYLTNLKFINT
jgi:hypothetical protein